MDSHGSAPAASAPSAPPQSQDKLGGYLRKLIRYVTMALGIALVFSFAFRMSFSDDMWFWFSTIFAGLLIITACDLAISEWGNHAILIRLFTYLILIFGFGASLVYYVSEFSEMGSEAGVHFLTDVDVNVANNFEPFGYLSRLALFKGKTELEVFYAEQLEARLDNLFGEIHKDIPARNKAWPLLEGSVDLNSPAGVRTAFNDILHQANEDQAYLDKFALPQPPSPIKDYAKRWFLINIKGLADGNGFPLTRILFWLLVVVCGIGGVISGFRKGGIKWTVLAVAIIIVALIFGPWLTRGH